MRKRRRLYVFQNARPRIRLGKPCRPGPFRELRGLTVAVHCTALHCTAIAVPPRGKTMTNVSCRTQYGSPSELELESASESESATKR
ncbi:hypothetical protein M0804_003365 [Polistes exclamans]|nr:hypothetical protein M0804_003365 [Polistes exclamans]